MRTICFIAVLLLMPSAVDAQCGWVLWKKIDRAIVPISTPGEITGSLDWQPQEGFDQIAACRASAAAYFVRETRIVIPTTDVKRYENGTSGLFTHPLIKGSQTIDDVYFICFPGGFDPRSSR